MQHMAIIHSLNLNEGGGIIPQNDRSQPENAASIIIGIGGTGVSALKIIKQKVFTQLIPSNPGESVPRYDMIRFLAIDTDETAVDEPQTVSDLQKRGGEFVGIKPQNLTALLDPQSPTGRTALRKRPDLNTWMSIDKIQPLLADDGAGGIRQMGRFMLFENIQRVYDAISSAITSAMAGQGAGGSVNVHVLAGISGGTGSGTFIDVCYLVRKVLQNNGWAGKLFGYFFLPDVVISKPGVRGNAIKEQLNRRNGYAAFRELDYLMGLDSAHDKFHQRYGGSIGEIDTDMPPVDLAHLISATDTQGNIPAKGFEYSLNVVADYILAYLAHVELDGKVVGQDQGLTMAGHLANIVAGVEQIQIKSGANYRYTVLGASNAEVPFSQIATYLAMRYYEKVAGISGTIPDDNRVNQFAAKVGLGSIDDIYNSLIRETPDAGALWQRLSMTDTDSVLHTPIGGDNQHAAALLQPCVEWASAYEGTVQDNCTGLSTDLPDFDKPVLGQNNSYIAAIHSQLMTLARNSDGQSGAKYAARLLSRTGRDLNTVVHGLIETNDSRLVYEQTQSSLIRSNLIAARDDFLRSNFFNRNGRWKNYLDALVYYYNHETRLYVMEKAGLLLLELSRQIQDLYTKFYVKLDKLCDNLSDTFAQNAAFLDDPERVAASNPYTWRVIELRDVKDDLDAVLRGIDPKIAAAQLMDWLLLPQNQEEWLSESDFRVGRVVNGFMQSAFREQLNATIETYIRSKYPGLKDQQIQARVEEEFLRPADSKAQPMFWKVPSYTMNGNTSFDSNIMTIPQSSALITQASSVFQDNMQNATGRGYVIRRSDINDRIFALRFNSGLPLFAYQGVTLMKGNYEANLNAGLVGLHLYESNYVLEHKENKTAEDLRVLEETAWGSFLPSPIPFSQAHTDQEEPTESERQLIALFNRAKACGVIAKDPVDSFWVVYSNNWDGVLPPHAREDFVADGQFDYDRLSSCMDEAVQRLDGWTDPANCAKLVLFNNRQVVEGYQDDVILDTFMRAPKLARIVADNLQKRDALEKLIADLRHLAEEASSGEALLQSFVDCLVTGVLTQKVGKIVYTVVEYGLEEEKRLDAEPEALSPQFQVYKAFVGFKGLDEQTRLDLHSKAQERLNDLNEGDDAVANSLRRKFKTAQRDIVGKAKLMPKADRDAILDFFTKYQSLLDDFCQQFGDSYIPFAKL